MLYLMRISRKFTTAFSRSFTPTFTKTITTALITTVVTTAPMSGITASPLPLAKATNQHLVAHEPSAPHCTDLMILASRGSEEHLRGVTPTKYSTTSDWVSNGWEGRNVRNWLQFVEAHHLRTRGTSLLHDIPVMGTTGAYYRADLPIPALIFEDPAVMALRWLWAFFNAPTILFDLIFAGSSFLKSMADGTAGLIQQVKDYEHRSGCQPRYILAAFSQGTVISAEAEKHLAAEGKLAGTMYIGNPFHREQYGISELALFTDLRAGSSDRQGSSLIGQAPSRIPGQLSSEIETPPAPHVPKTERNAWGSTINSPGTANRVDYCTTGDIVCSSSDETLATLFTVFGGTHDRYMETNEEENIAAAEAVITMIERAREE